LANIKEDHIGNSQGGDEGRILNISCDTLYPDAEQSLKNLLPVRGRIMVKKIKPAILSQKMIQRQRMYWVKD